MVEENLPILYALERTVVQFWQRYPDTSDHTVKRVYEMAAKVYRAEATGHELQMPEAEGADAALFDDLLQVCRQLRSTGADDARGGPATGPVSAETLFQCLRRLIRSVDKHTRVGGSRGYLDLLSRYVRL